MTPPTKPLESARGEKKAPGRVAGCLTFCMAAETSDSSSLWLQTNGARIQVEDIDIKIETPDVMH